MRISTSFLCPLSEVSSILDLYLNGMQLQNNDIIQTIYRYVNMQNIHSIILQSKTKIFVVQENRFPIFLTS
jgi:hypothetical protein